MDPVQLGPDDAAARALMARRRWKDAAARVTATAPGPRYVKGMLSVRADQPLAAIAALEGVPEAIPLLAAHAHVLRAQAWMQLRRYDAALGEVDALPADTAIGREARRLKARALRESGRDDAARAVYQVIIDSGLDDEVPAGLLGLARLEADRGQMQSAVDRLRRVDLDFPTHWAARPARVLADKLTEKDEKLARRYGSRTPAEELGRGERLLAYHRNLQAVKVLEPLSKARLDRGQTCRQRYSLGRALRKLRRWKLARPVIEEAVERCGAVGGDLLAQALYQAGAAAERLAFEDEAAAHYRRLMEKHPDSNLADDAGYFLVRHLVEDKKDLAAAFALAEKLVERFPNGDLVPRAAFFVAVHALVAKDGALARRALLLDPRLPPRDVDYRDAGRTEYWLARLEWEAGEKASARGRLESVIATHPLSWYAVLAYGRLRELDPAAAKRFTVDAMTRLDSGPMPPCGEEDGWSFPLPAGAQPEAFARALLLTRLGLAEPAWKALQEAGIDRTATDDVLWMVAWMLDRAGAYRLSHDLLRRQLPVYRRFPPGSALRKYWTLAFPTPFGDIVGAASKATDVDAHLIWAIMREESGFRPSAESFANAMGLMQLILPTAKRMATKAERPITRDKLSDPELNVNLGARYLAHLGDRVDDMIPLLPAGYNAGGGALKRWLGERGDLPLDLFIETIPFEETRGYTKRVVSSWATYRYLYGGKLEEPLPYLTQTLPAEWGGK